MLTIIGLIHGIGLWDRDILLPYALTGLFGIKFICFNSLRQLDYKSIVIYLSGLIIFPVLVILLIPRLFSIQQKMIFLNKLTLK